MCCGWLSPLLHDHTDQKDASLYRFQGLIEELQAAVASEGTSRRAAAAVQTKLVFQSKEVRAARRQIQKLQNEIRYGHIYLSSLSTNGMPLRKR